MSSNPSTTEDPPHRGGRWVLNMSRLKRSPVCVVLKLGEGATSEVNLTLAQNYECHLARTHDTPAGHGCFENLGVPKNLPPYPGPRGSKPKSVTVSSLLRVHAPWHGVEVTRGSCQLKFEVQLILFKLFLNICSRRTRPKKSTLNFESNTGLNRVVLDQAKP
ncbi:hypothetical protein TNCV_2990551 [Trichonephila clavipes]|nr:hypothetical protein TNCV_2990551 [Trichonephila clavipes]